MATLRQISYSIWERLRPEIGDDDSISERQLEFDINNFRAVFLRNELNKNRSIDSDIQQTLCLDLEEVDPSDCCDVTIGCDLVLRSTKPIPKTVEMHNKQAITRIGPVNKTNRPFSLVDYERVPYVGSGKFNKNEIFTFVHNGYVFVISNDDKVRFLENAIVKGVFEDPIAVGKFKDCSTGEPCFTRDSEYPIKNWMVASLEDAVFNKYVTTLQLPEDNTNDSKSNPNPVD